MEMFREIYDLKKFSLFLGTPSYILHAMKRIGHLWRRNCLLKHEGKIERGVEVKERRGRRRKALLDDLQEKKGYWKLKTEALDRALWRTYLGRSY
jgi:hypothetical protein